MNSSHEEILLKLGLGWIDLSDSETELSSLK